MFVFSVKTSKKQLIRLTGGAVLAMLALFMTAVLPKNETAVMAHGGSADQRISCLQALGYEVMPEEVSVREIAIPDQPDEAFIAYNKLQKEAGFDLSGFLGKRIKCYTYAVTNYPDHPQMLANVWVRKGKIIGGDLTDAADPSFSTGLVKRPTD